MSDSKAKHSKGFTRSYSIGGFSSKFSPETRRGLHKLGSIPSYLRNKNKPATAPVCFKPSKETIAGPAKEITSQKPSSNKSKKSHQNNSQQQSSDLKQSQLHAVVNPPCEGTEQAATQVLVQNSLEEELILAREKVRQLEEKCKLLEVDCSKQLERARDARCAQDFEQDVVKSIANLQIELGHECSELTKTRNILEKLQEKLTDLVMMREKTETRNLDLQEEFAKQETELQDEITDLMQKDQERKLEIEKLQPHVTTLSREITETNTAIASLKDRGAVRAVGAEKIFEDPTRGELKESLGLLLEQMKNFRTELCVPTDTKQQKVILQEIRTKLIDLLAASKEAFNIRRDKQYNFAGENNRLQTDFDEQGQFEGFEMLCSIVADLQRKCYTEENIICELRHDNRKCQAVRRKLQSILKQLQNESRQTEKVM